MKESICKYMPAKNYGGNIKTINFVYEADFKNLTQPFFVPVYIIHLVTKGCGFLKTDMGSFELFTGCVFFTFPGSFYEIDASDDFEYMYISFTGNNISVMFEGLGISAEKPVFQNFDIVTDFWLESIRRTTTYNANILPESVLLYTLSFICDGETQESASADNDSLSDAIVEYVNLHYHDKDLSLKQIAGIFSYSQKYVSYLFKKITDVGFNDYVNHLRIQYACSLIDNKVTSVAQLSELCGFSDPLYFSKVFKKKKGFSPTVYIQQRSNN